MRLTFLALPLFAAALHPSAHHALASTPSRPSTAEILFRLAHPCPVSGETTGACKGYVIDRVIPIVCGGAEDPSNMRWVTVAEAKAKARWDRIGCRRGRKLVLPGEAESTTEAFATGDAPAPVQPIPLGPGKRPPEIPTTREAPEESSEAPPE